MNKEEIFKLIQKYIKDVPLLLIGTGATIPEKLPSMNELSDYLISNLNDKYCADTVWDKFAERLNDGIDLESALIDLSLKEEIINNIVIQTWKLVSERDLNLLNKIVTQKHKLPLAKLIKKLFEPNPRCLNIITTNYDRVIEYACDEASIPCNNSFQGNYIKYMSNADLGKKNIVNVLKVHGSLDLFKDSDNLVYSIPLQQDIPGGFVPEIITPGSSKYRTVLVDSTHGKVFHKTNELINNAKSYLCIGYGFNDEHIQANILSSIRQGKPIVVVTKKLTEKASSLLVNNSDNYVVVQQDSDDENNTEFLVSKKRFIVEGTYWTIDGFMEII